MTEKLSPEERRPRGDHMIPVAKTLVEAMRRQAAETEDDDEARECRDIANLVECLGQCIANETARAEKAEQQVKELAETAMGNGVEIGRLLVVNAKLGNALAKLTDACHLADAGEGLSEEIDGSLLDAAEEAIALIERFPPPRIEIPEEE